MPVKTVAIIQARMGSTRLPGKVLKDICGETMLARVVRRTRLASLLNEVVVATTLEPLDQPIEDECRSLGAPVFRGSENDVLDRYYRAAQAHDAGVVVRITSDCPLIDAEVIDQVIRAFFSQPCDYASNGIERTFPRGLDTEVMSLKALARAWHEAKESYQRVHVTPYLWQNPDRFRLVSVKGEMDLSQHRWTVDTSEDLEFVRQVYHRLKARDVFSWREALAVVEDQPELMELNRNIHQRALHEG
jgi:spore coat polysaccharide biosynthesis protein SpsF